MKRQNGFTLIEISIVLTIIGLIIGGMLAGAQMLRAAEVRSLIGDMEKYREALHLFQSKYNALPGDMPNAESFWGADSGCPGTGANDTPKMETCNGNGDGFIGSTTGNPRGSVTTESYRVWQHLGNSGIVEGSFSGVVTTAGPPQAGINVPGSRYGNTLFSVIYGSAGSGADYYDADYGHVLLVGAAIDATNTTTGPSLTGPDAFVIDQKLDDGHPALGVILAFFVMPGLNACTTDMTPASANYFKENDELRCSLIYKTGL